MMAHYNSSVVVDYFARACARVRVCARVCAGGCARNACVCVRVRACACACACVPARVTFARAHDACGSALAALSSPSVPICNPVARG